MKRSIRFFTKPSECLHVADLTTRHNTENLTDLFSSYGNVERVDLKNVSRDMHSLVGYAFVRFSSEAEAIAAKVALDGQMSFGRKLRYFES